ncbi:MAG: KGK domain-containing protein [Elainella sp. Prado103]|jgi:hypothetical protein|nr:KGK domain-containing protein [Elainella sp. Prado103]
MDKDFGLLSDDEVLFVRSGRILMANPTFKVSEFLDSLAQLISEQEGEWSDEREGWFTDRGQTCEVLRFGNQGWQRGRVRIRLEFCPDNPPKLLKESAIVAETSYADEFRDDLYTPRRPPENSTKDATPWRGNDDRYPDIDEDY